LRKFADLFHAHQGRLVDKWEHYFPIYDAHFAKYQDKPVRVLEIGVSHGGSLQIWKQYFGAKAEIIGLDIDPRCEDYEEDQIQIYTGDQSKLVDSPKLDAFVHHGPFDVVIDDGSHVVAHQEASFKALWPSTRGVYLIEDIHGAMPSLMGQDGLVTRYPWVLVVERPKRLIRGTPSRELRQDEIEAINLYGDK
jgi:cephalosporin hydroxylase